MTRVHGKLWPSAHRIFTTAVLAAVTVPPGFTGAFTEERLSDPPKATEPGGGGTEPHRADFL